MTIIKIRHQMILGVTALALVGSAQAQKTPQVVSTTAPQAVASEPENQQQLLGRLFFSREQRERINRARARGEHSQNSELIEDPPPSMLNGFVKRSDGQTMIWVDGLARFNVQAEGVRRLQPQDVGNSGEFIRVLATESESARRPPAPARSLGANKPAKPGSSSMKKPLVRQSIVR